MNQRYLNSLLEQQMQPTLSDLMLMEQTPRRVEPMMLAGGFSQQTDAGLLREGLHHTQDKPAPVLPDPTSELRNSEISEKIRRQERERLAREEAERVSRHKMVPVTPQQRMQDVWQALKDAAGY